MGAVAYLKLIRGDVAALDCDVVAGLIRPENGRRKASEGATG